MLDTIPSYVSLLFLAITILTIWFLYKASRSLKLVSLIIVLTVIQFFVERSGFYNDHTSIPPHAMLLAFPSLIIVLLLFITRQGKQFIDTMDAKWLTYLHSIRIPVEIVLFCLSVYKLVPQLMTFEGRNFDILSGISAPFIAWFAYEKKSLSKNILLGWNIVCLLLLMNVVINAVLSIPGPLQRQAFDQPNIAVLHFPFIYLPGLIVPAVLFSHLVCIRRIVLNKI